VTNPKEILDTVGNTADGVFAVDANQRIIKWNSGAERILKYSSDQVLNHDCYRVIAGHINPEKLWCRANCKVHSCVLKGTPLENIDLLTQTNEGEPIWINVSIVSPPPGNEPITVHVFRNVTREKRAGQAVDQFLAALGMNQCRIFPVEKSRCSLYWLRAYPLGLWPNVWASVISRSATIFRISWSNSSFTARHKPSHMPSNAGCSRSPSKNQPGLC
jgi:PAS domain S-box-containing protein